MVAASLSAMNEGERWVAVGLSAMNEGERWVTVSHGAKAMRKGDKSEK